METSRRNYGKEFEEEVKNFLEEKLELDDIKGGPGFHIAPPGKKNQTHVCGRFGDILFVFQCKAAGRKVSKNFRNEILATRERARIILKNYRNIPEYANCKFVVFVFITKRIQVPESNVDLLENEKPKVWYTSGAALEYYSDLHDKIGKYAVYNFLADFGVRPSEAETLSVTALRTKLGKYNVYSFYVRPKELLKFSYVARRRSTKENFYQRMLEGSRISRIKDFLNNGGVFPTNIIISIRKGERAFKKIEALRVPEDISLGTLTISNSYNACWIVDGQHRLYSYAKSKSNSMIPCIAFDNIRIEDERRFFLEINREQKPIQADLIWDLEGLANPETPRGIISNIVRTLNNREPFLDRIYIPVKGSRAGKLINMAAFCNGINNSRITNDITPNCIGRMNPLYVEVVRTMVNRNAGVLQRYFSSIYENMQLEHRQFLSGNAGVPIMLYLLEPIVARIGHIPSTHDLRKYVRSIQNFFEENYPDPTHLKELREEANSEGSRRSIAREIGSYIRRETKDPRFWPRMEESESAKEITKMERRIGKLISKKLSEITTSWQKQRIPQSIYLSARKKMDSDGTDFDENLDLGDERQIILKKDNWSDVFQGIFVNKDGFMHEQELELAFTYLSRIRNPIYHGKSVRLTKVDFDQCNICLQKFNRVVPETIPEVTDLQYEPA
jgi:DNA sulfur modification protein DndB